MTVEVIGKPERMKAVDRGTPRMLIRVRAAFNGVTKLFDLVVRHVPEPLTDEWVVKKLREQYRHKIAEAIAQHGE